MPNQDAGPPDAGLPAVELRQLTFTYAGAASPVFAGLSLAVPQGARCLLLGGNGVGKSTLLRLVGGRYLLPPDMIRVYGRPAFHDTALSAEVAFLGGAFPFVADISVQEILAGRPGVDPARRDHLVSLLEVDRGWRMHQVSDGQRRRVQILLDLERTVRLVLLDEVTADLDILARAELLRFLRRESQDRRVTTIYATHVLDGLQDWATHLMFLGRSGLRRFAEIDAVPELQEGGAPAVATSRLHRLCEQWMGEDRRARVMPG
jgi:CCR4-NOT complex subunit CAF16